MERQDTAKGEGMTTGDTAREGGESNGRREWGTAWGSGGQPGEAGGKWDAASLTNENVTSKLQETDKRHVKKSKERVIPQRLTTHY